MVEFLNFVVFFKQIVSKIDKIRDENNTLRSTALKHWNILNDFTKKSIPIPNLLEIPKESEETKKSSQTSKSYSIKSSQRINIMECGICHQTKDQHQLALCDSCKLHYHLYCLDPPLTRMPKKTRFGGWQCSDCTEQQETQSEGENSNHSNLDAPRKLREHVKGPNKFEPDAGYSPSSSISSASKLRKRKPLLKKRKRKRLKKALSETSEISDLISEKSSSRSKSVTTPPPKKPVNTEEKCHQCNEISNSKLLVQ